PHEAAVTSCRCDRGYIDSTGRSPSRTPSLFVKNDASIKLDLLNVETPKIVEARMYSGAGISASFMQWPEHMPRADQAIATFQPEPAPTFRTDVDLPSGIYSLVVYATLEQPVGVFYALSFTVE
ncbi:MAG TPA: hypothetical protein DC056_02330, partial [Dehalococcoidia bacterium]|nr:hypothetical protein [Dehalococcoidia bacterium]